MVDEKEFFEQAEVVDIVSSDVTAKLKEYRDEINKLYAKLIANPYLAPHLIPDFRSNLMGTMATLMEEGIPISDNPKIRTPEDVVSEGLAELGGMVGGRLVGGIMKMKKGFENTIKSDNDEFVVYRDPDSGTYYFIDENDDEVDCDQHGTPLEE